ncbi:hypothetical protein PIB30_073356 [Stylosanthes scabra]|uniref:Disease resistance RPP13-like protein 1 n=1 Tax=Stylosanthes scabra TaxID=79078 RepID=A0ABU6TQW1_9FABA|nr:hypothetical protein [Stylosanthes scabra]
MFTNAAEENIKSFKVYVAELKELVAKLYYQKHLLICQVLELEANKYATEETDTTGGSPVPWEFLFEQQRQQIIMLWHLCHISLVHRTQFYLLLRGDPSDQIYAEVEFRRLTWLEQHLAELGNASPALLGDEPADYVSASIRALRQEREYLAKRVNSKLTAQERELVYAEWEVPPGGKKQRRLEFINKLWSDPYNIHHVQESAQVVAKLIDFCGDENSKDMFELNFAGPYTEKTSGFEQAIQGYAIHVLSLTYQKVPRAVLAEAINIEGLSLDKFLERQVANYGWAIEKTQGKGHEFNDPVLKKNSSDSFCVNEAGKHEILFHYQCIMRFLTETRKLPLIWHESLLAFVHRFLTTDTVNMVLGKKLGPDLVERLKISLLSAEALVVDAEHKQLENQAVREWLNSLRDALYVADDFLDDVLTKAATQKEVRSFWPSFLLNRDRDMVDKIEGVVRRIEFLVKQKDFLGLQTNTKDNNLSSSSWRASTSLMEGNIYGREDDQQALIKIMNDNSESQLSVIPIVGMGGVGKTTLAKWLYSDVKGFDLKAWVCISETFDIVEITRTTIEEITKSTCTFRSLNSLQNELQKMLLGKKFFIVLDDVWSDDADKWKQFITPFQSGAKGSTILLTTRIKEVASVVQTCPSWILNGLSEDYCWLLFADNACFPESNGNSTLEEIGRKIVNKCKGLPLAVETLGRLLRAKDDFKEWSAVLTSDIWKFSMKNSKIIPALLISYFQLPAYIKRCFVYCSLYPKDYCFEKDKLILLWMAEDLLRQPKRGESLEEVGCECFEELLSRLFFKQYQKSYKMHDLLHDLALFLAGDFYCRSEELGRDEGLNPLTRHLSFESLSPLVSKNSDSINKVESLRTLLALSFSSQSNNFDDATCILISKLKHVRVLLFHLFKGLNVLPESIGELIHLRYLDISETSIRALPESLCNLYNLQTLKLSKCCNLTRLPNGMHNLVNLRHLNVSGAPLEEMPGGMSKLKNLHILTDFVVGKNKDNGIQELGGLSNLHGSLEIKKIENVVDIKEAKRARIMDKRHIDCLQLQWSSSGDIVSNTQNERDILDSLQPHNDLKELRIKGYKGTIFPNWVGYCSYSNMTCISLSSCNNCCMLPSLGELPSLQSLSIKSFGQLKIIGHEFYKNEASTHNSSPIAPFPSLHSLDFQDMPCWEVWHSSGPEAFPQLKRLQIHGCPMLKDGIPNFIIQRFISLLSEAPEVRRLDVREDHTGGSQELSFSGNTLTIKGCESLVEFAFQEMTINHFTYLQLIELSGCSSAISFPGNCLPKSLQMLTILKCQKLEFPQQQHQKYDLVGLLIYSSCDSLTSLSLDAFPNLEFLDMFGCKSLESVSMSLPQEAALDSLPKNGCSNLTHLYFRNCSKLKVLPCHMNTLLPNLERFQIQGCPELHEFPEGGLPPNLKVLSARKSLLSSVGSFNSLNDLTIEGDDCDRVKSFPELGSLPHLPSLTFLKIWRFLDLETLECNELLRLPSLQELYIERCPKLESMAGEKMPPSLLQLYVYECPLLEERCKKKYQQIWPKISHIPSIGYGVTYLVN